MRAGTKALAALAAIVLVASPAAAQQPGRPGGPGGRGMMGMGGGAMLASSPRVQEELKLTEDQKGKVETLASELREKFQGLREQLQDVPQAERMERARELTAGAVRESRQKLADILKPEQMSRLEQIELQARGADALADEQVQERLSLSEDQKSKLREILSEANAKRREIFESAQGDFQSAMADLRELRDKTLDDVKALLTDDQKGKWKEMTGEPFELNLGAGRRGGPGAN